MLHQLEAWDRYLDYRFWWVHAMTLVWMIFTLILFVLEPLLFHRVFKRFVQKDAKKAFAIMHLAHWILLSLSLLSAAGAVAGSHRWFWIS